MKKEMLIIIAIILAILICWANLYITFNTGGGWVNAGMGALIVALVIILLHGLLLFLMILIAKNFSLGHTMLAWGFLIFIYFVPALNSHLDQVQDQKRKDVEQAAKTRIIEGNATIDDFVYLYQNYDIQIIINAYKQGYREIAEKLLAADCDPSSDRIFEINNSCYYTYDSTFSIKKYGKEDVRKKVLGLWLIYATNEQLPEIVNRLLNAGANVNVKECSEVIYTTPLMAASKTGQLSLVRIFLEKGADINVMDADGNDAIYFAVCYHHAEIVKLLIEHGADLDRQYVLYSDKPRVPLLSIAQYYNEGWNKNDKSKEIVELLTQKSHEKR